MSPVTIREHDKSADDRESQRTSPGGVVTPNAWSDRYTEADRLGFARTIPPHADERD